MNTTLLKVKLDENIFQLPDIKRFLGKNVEILIKEIKDKKPSKGKAKLWEYSGSVDLKGSLDNVNLRDYSYE